MDTDKNISLIGYVPQYLNTRCFYGYYLSKPIYSVAKE